MEISEVEKGKTINKMKSGTFWKDQYSRQIFRKFTKKWEDNLAISGMIQGDSITDSVDIKIILKE